MTVYRSRARRSHGPRLDDPTLVQFVLLSMLLHILAIVLFGATGKGGAGRGEGLPETLDVTLRPIAPESRTLRPAPREAVPPAIPSAGRGAERTERRVAPSSLPERFELTAPPETTPSAQEPFLRPSPGVPENIERASRPAAPEPRIEAIPERLEPVAPTMIQRELAQPIEAPRALPPIAPSVPLDRIVPPAVERPLAKPLQLPRQAVPVAPAATIKRLAPPAGERELTPPIEALPERPLAPEAPIERMVSPAVEHELAPPVVVPARPLLSSPAAPLEHVQPPPSKRELASPTELPPASLPSRAAPQPAPPPPRPSASLPNAGPTAAPTPAPESLPAPRLGAPRPEEDIFKPRGQAPGLDLEAAKKRAVREIAGEGSGSPGVLPFPLPIPDTKTKEAKAMEKAIKPDCRTAYSGMGLLAVPVLIAATITDEGCRW
ncbi:MAG TPA: hypothetical protein VL742_04600 [Casimicrobiaceae bacterium]|nr:hypothetical protein [Casimicrobiaceae bacterium]